MSITVNTLKLDGSGWAINAHSDVTSASPVEILAAPGSGKFIRLREVSISVEDSAIAFLSSRVSATATANRILGPLYISPESRKYQDKFIIPIRVTENENLMFSTSADSQINIYASGFIK